jgi:hypothetical protein
MDQPEVIRVQASEIADVYKNTRIDPSAYAGSRKGISIVCQVNDILRVTETTDPTYCVDLPISCHMVLKVPQNANITADAIMSTAGRCLATLFDSNQLTSGRIGNLLRGAMIPSGI